MDFAFLSRLALACCDGTMPYHKGANLHELFVCTERAETASREFAAALQSAFDAAPPENETLKAALLALDSANGNAICDYEEQGFLNGFRFAVKLFTECGGPAARKNT